MVMLITGLALFLGMHSVSLIPGLRALFARAIGEGGYKLIYTVLSVVGLALIIFGKIQAHPTPNLYYPEEWTRTLALFAIPLSLILLAAAYTPSHIRKVLRHPMLLAVFIWSGTHLMANGEQASVVLFASFFAWSGLSLIAAYIRGGGKPAPKGWGGDVTAIVAGALVSAIFARLHPILFGVDIIG
ncbi:NnrU family protein [Hyphobacterium marinum]|uniref:NnrU family protein n=1 Tax=Hyphobacterium marinum TaxID=3116574 RepID=A0ABU7M184_9PROT|nr:NnrU family protein [Hyphobacterium sp. Y6023]MEE2567160.1 NnrU family protein [Hyphobacterium sp. Y6023]